MIAPAQPGFVVAYGNEQMEISFRPLAGWLWHPNHEGDYEEGYGTPLVVEDGMLLLANMVDMPTPYWVVGVYEGHFPDLIEDQVKARLAELILEHADDAAPTNSPRH